MTYRELRILIVTELAGERRLVVEESDQVVTKWVSSSFFLLWTLLLHGGVLCYQLKFLYELLAAAVAHFVPPLGQFFLTLQGLRSIFEDRLKLGFPHIGSNVRVGREVVVRP